MCYSNSASFIELLRSFCIQGEACAKILYLEKELLNLKDSKLTQNFYGNKTGFVRLGHICDWILENRSKSHIWYFKKYQFQIFITLHVFLSDLHQ